MYYMYIHKYNNHIQDAYMKHIDRVLSLLEIDTHLLLVGNDGYAIIMILEYIFRKRISNYNDEWVFKTITIQNEANTEILLHVRQSNRHIEIMLQQYGTVDKYIVTDFILNKIKMLLIDDHTCKLIRHTVVLYFIEHLNIETQYILATLLKIYISSVRFIFVSSQTSSISEHVKSNCVQIIIPSLENKELYTLLSHVIKKENICISKDEICKIMEDSKTIEQCMMRLYRFKYSIVDSYDAYIEEIVDDVLKNANMSVIRTKLYNVIINNVMGVNFLTVFTKKMLSKGVRHDVVIPLVTKTSHNIIQSERVIYQLESFIQSLLYYLHK